MSSTTTATEELYAVADFCLIPMGLETPSVGPQIAECQRVLEKSGLEYHTDIRIGTRVDKRIEQGGNAGKVSRVEDILAKDTK
ncbi:hypothetical protein QFC22_002959 [Naganishia vaughanmartiniae]|uniref:Uncharacterized protein n=1 Tax=Naganishia vaughanmartiniae TaxID=1424756 RepID=A0ACC2XBC3_9TREE|nr:hypothetical protein QFC22_002959 [Naganishia vaughanmartiniae]